MGFFDPIVEVPNSHEWVSQMPSRVWSRRIPTVHPILEMRTSNYWELCLKFHNVFMDFRNGFMEFQLP